jgi:hypothetical protein
MAVSLAIGNRFNCINMGSPDAKPYERAWHFLTFLRGKIPARQDLWSLFPHPTTSDLSRWGEVKKIDNSGLNDSRAFPLWT